MVYGGYKFHQYHIVGRHVPTEKLPNPAIFRMKIWAPDPVKAKSKFWYFLKKLRRVKKANGQIIAVNEIYERKPTTTKNYGIWLRYQSRTGYHNAFKEFRDVTLNGAVEQLYQEMASRHRVRYPQIWIIKTAVLKASECKRPSVTQFHNSKIKFPITRKMLRPSKPEFKTTFKAKRPNAAVF
eukprot:TRINITY_DN314_c0_g1_i2.p2 TRINITY_DN314_c0_g1~~TRINITY_DN314_c0_g1_i2.p2  ORF type:complete len:182 (+),score=21.39 TRINITY_DN314_c0_g1_i2:363-908(+)